MSTRRRVALGLALVGVCWSALAVIDPYRPSGAVWGPLIVATVLLWQWRAKHRVRTTAALLVLALAYSVASSVLIEIRADSNLYYAYLRSAFFDADFDFRNEREAYGLPPLPVEVNPRRNVFSVGPALLWSPFYAAAHAYVLIDNAGGSGIHEPDGYGVPYRQATALGTVTYVVIGSLLLATLIAQWFGRGVAALSLLGAVLASPVLYYTFHVPGMAHGVTYGVAAAFVWAAARARAHPTARSWVLMGLLLGVVTICRWQAAVYAIVPIALATEGLIRRTVPLRYIAGFTLAGAIGFAPQLLAWMVQYGSWLTLPQGHGFINLAAYSWVMTLFSANHGFFNWTPLMLVGFFGLVLGLRRQTLFYGAALGVFVATIWVNGSVPEYDYAAGDAYGARRYSLVVPLVALGLAAFLDSYTKFARKVPLAVPAGIIAIAVAWNLGFISHFRARKYPEMAPLERLARDQVRGLRLLTQDVLGWVAGEEGRAFAYDLFSAEYFYTGFNRSGRILLRSADERYLIRGWHTPSRRIARRTFRRALYPEACVRLPLNEKFPLRIAITARAPDGVSDQTLTVTMNGDVVSRGDLPNQWKDIRFVAPEESLVHGENELCLGFSHALPPEEGTLDRRVAAYVEKIQLP